MKRSLTAIVVAVLLSGGNASLLLQSCTASAVAQASGVPPGLTVGHYKILEGICKWLRSLASPTGFEPVLPP